MYTPDNPPPQSIYVQTIHAIRPQLDERSIKVLEFQFQQPARAVTSQDIRDLFGYPSIGASNLLYGNLGKRFATSFNMQTELPGSSRTNYWKSLSTGDGSGEHFTWIMRPELASALIETGLVNPALDGLAPLPDLDIHGSSFSAVEGRKSLVLHLLRERNRSLVAAKKATANSHACEVCGFDSLNKYGEAYCEVHHLTPLSELAEDTETTLNDLAIVCANCHRILHLYNPPLTIDDLRARLKQQ